MRYGEKKLVWIPMVIAAVLLVIMGGCATEKLREKVREPWFISA